MMEGNEENDSKWGLGESGGAGSERVARSEAAGEQLREAQAINRSLSALGDVIAALQRKGPHIPFRNSKLTQARAQPLLQSHYCDAVPGTLTGFFWKFCIRMQLCCYVSGVTLSIP
jgi:hypothetical protein